MKASVALAENRRLAGTTRRIAHKGRRGSLATAAYTQIKEETLRGRFAIGAILSRRRLAGLLNMSFVPITEALQRLEAEGLAESRPRIGTRVRIPTQDDIRGTHFLCEALEAQAARLCAARMSTGEKDKLRRNADRLDKFYRTAKGEHDRQFLFSVHTCHMQFHLRIAEFAGCSKLTRAIEKERALVFNWLYDSSGRRVLSRPNAHIRLSSAICSSDVLKAEQAMRAHIHYGFEKVLEHFSHLDHDNAWRFRRSEA
jgi:DNA-binding GntR family transcriptional regulator